MYWIMAIVIVLILGVILTKKGISFLRAVNKDLDSIKYGEDYEEDYYRTIAQD